MPLNESKGNMYAFVTHTWNAIKGKCPHDCSYCYMKRWGKQKDLHFDEKELKTDLGTGNFIFVGSSCDMWADEINPDWILDTLAHCCKYNNRYLFQSKSPWNVIDYIIDIPKDSVIGTTIESNRQHTESCSAINTLCRAKAICLISNERQTMVTIEPIMDFDTDRMIELITLCNPKWVNIGADTGGHKLPEPPAGKVRKLIAELSKFTEVKIKKNLKRIMGRTWDQLPG